jgi:hypothetical protein
MMPDDASPDGAQNRMMAGIMARNAAGDCALEAAGGVSLRRRKEAGARQSDQHGFELDIPFKAKNLEFPYCRRRRT